MGWTRTGGKNTGHCHLPANLIAYAMDCQELNTWLHTWMHRHQWLHIQAKNQTVHWAFRAALCTVSLKECQRAFTSPPLSQSIDSTLFCLLSKKQRRLLLYCVCVSVCEWMLFIIVHSPISPGCVTNGSVYVCVQQIHIHPFILRLAHGNENAHIFYPSPRLLKYRRMVRCWLCR